MSNNEIVNHHCSRAFCRLPTGHLDFVVCSEVPFSLILKTPAPLGVALTAKSNKTQELQ